VEPITSLHNARVRDAAKLARTRTRRERGRHLVEGPNAVGEAARAGHLEELFAAVGTTLPAGAEDHEVTWVTAEVLARLADAVSPQGVVGVARTPVHAVDEVVGHGLLVVLHEVADPGNAGTILRTADAAGASGVVLTSGSVDPFGPKAVRAAAGSTYHLPVVTDVSLPSLADACREVGQRVVGLDGGATASVRDLEQPAGPIALVLGNEAHGLGAQVRARLDGLVAVPIHGRAESLNVAAAAAVALYAAARGLGLGGEVPTLGT
jgi:TrmH family RNA methyltransferase